MTGEQPIQCHPNYHEGYGDAARMEPLFDDACPIYEAGWRAYWEGQALLKLILEG